MSTLMKLIIMNACLIYLVVGITRNHLKAIRLYNQGKTKSHMADLNYLKYLFYRKIPTLGDVLFLPAQSVFLALTGGIIGFLKLLLR